MSDTLPTVIRCVSCMIMTWLPQLHLPPHVSIIQSCNRFAAWLKPRPDMRQRPTMCADFSCTLSIAGLAICNRQKTIES